MKFFQRFEVARSVEKYGKYLNYMDDSSGMKNLHDDGIEKKAL